MDESLYTRLKRACADATSAGDVVSDDTDDSYDPEEDAEVASFLFETNTSDTDSIPSDDSAVVDLRRVGVDSGEDGENQSRVGFDPPQTQHLNPNDVTSGTGRPRRRTFDNAMRLISAFNADEDSDAADSADVSSSDSENSDDGYSPTQRKVRKKVKRKSPPATETCATRTVNQRGRRGRQSGGPTTAVRAQRRDKVQEQADYYEKRPLVGSRRHHAGPDGGASQNGIFYGPGVILDNDFLQPRDLTLPPVKIMPRGYGWRGRPKRTPLNFEFKPKRVPGVHHIKPEWTCTEIFEELWKEPEEIWRNATNDKGREMCQKMGRPFKEVTKAETRAFLACKLWIDLFKKPSLRLYWSKHPDFCSPFILRVRDATGMSHRRFQQIKLWTRLYDKQLATATGIANPQSPNFDVSHKAREYLNAINRSCEKFMEPDEIISFDESMLEYIGVGGEKQTIRSKPIPTGLMFYAACTRRGYFLRSLLHAKQTLPYWEEFGVPFSTVWSILSGSICWGLSNYLDTGRTLITDRAYTSVSLAYALAFRSTYFIGTVKRSSKCVPDCLLKETQRDGSVKVVNKVSKHAMARGDAYFLHDNAGVVSFCAWQDNKVVPLLFTSPTVEEMGTCKRLVKGGKKEGNEFGRPMILNVYDSGMGGVDIGDQHIAAQHRPTRCYVWYTPILFRSFDVFCNNVFCIKQEFGHQMPMLQVKLSIAYGMLQKLKDGKDGARASLEVDELAPSEVDGIHNPYTVDSAFRTPCTACKIRTTTGCETCAVPTHLNDCWKVVHKPLFEA